MVLTTNDDNDNGEDKDDDAADDDQPDRVVESPTELLHTVRNFCLHGSPHLSENFTQ